jgi:hypothetical protein
MSKTVARVIIPTNPAEVLDLAKKVSDKHIADAASSPLNALVDNKWSLTQPFVAPAIAKHKEAEDYKKKMEEAYRERDKHIDEIIESVKSSRDVLVGINKKNPKVLGQWGFVVNDTPLPSKASKSKKQTPPEN